MPESEKEKKARTEREKALRDTAKEVVCRISTVYWGLRAKLLQIRGEEEQYKVDHHVTTGADSGEGTFTSERAPAVHKVVVDKGSGSGYVEIAGGGLKPYFIRTSPDRSGIEVVEIQGDQTCMIHGRSSVLYIRPRS